MNTSISGSGTNESPNDIAIIGMSCRFPGDVYSPGEFYEFLLRGGDGIVPVPPDRWDNKAYFDADKEKKNRMYVNRGGFLRDIDQFDPLFFGISPAEATRVDPQHRWLLELTHEALENAGLTARALKGSDTAVYIGQFMHDYEQLQLDSQAHTSLNSHSATGPSMTLTANRISYVFDLKGPSVTLDTACSSSLVAVDLACKALLSGDSRLAVAGGVNILLRPELTMSICKASMLSPDGRCKSFDAAANGYVRSEGAGIVLLKKLSDAQRDGDNVFAVIKSTGVNQDGQTLGITVPNGDAQKALLLRSLERAGIDKADIQYVEAHGTGTAVGDPIEVNALGSVVGERAAGSTRCVVGSVKSNIGHTEAAAGVAGLIKTVMAMRRGIIPHTLHYRQTNPAIDLERLNVRIADENIPWPDTAGRPRQAVVNSFGFGGTNANLILQEAPPPAPVGVDQKPVYHGAMKLLPLSSKTEQGLRGQATKYRDFFALRQQRGYADDAEGTLHDVCYTASVRREHEKHRLVLSGASEAELQAALDAFLNGEASAAYAKRAANPDARQVCFVFSGMGTQWPGMGRELYRTEPVFRETFDRCSAALQPYTGWSLIDAVHGDEAAARINDTCVAQPAIFAIQVALSALLKSWGLEPSAVVGHSAGEVSAAYVAGALRFEDAIRVVYHRSRLQQTTEGTGKMLAVGLGEADLRPLLAGKEDCVSIAAINSDDALTLSGEEKALASIAAALDEKGVFARFLKVGVPYHSPVMDRLKAPLIEALQGIEVQTPHTPLYSTVSGKLTQPGDWGPAYWADNVREAVLFKSAVEAVARDGVQAFLEVAAHPALSSSVEKTLARANRPGFAVPTLKREQNDAAMLAAALGLLHASGGRVDWSRLYPNRGRIVALPNYAWQHASYWCEAPEVQRARLKNVSASRGFSDLVHPLLGSKLHSVIPLWQREIDLQDLAYLADHQVESEPVYPAAGYIEMALAIARRDAIPARLSLEDIAFHRALFLDAQKPTPFESTVDSDGSRIAIHAIDAATGRWNLYCTATPAESAPAETPRRVDLAALLQPLTTRVDRGPFYEHCAALGLTYQNAFQAVQCAWHAENDVVVELRLPASLEGSVEEYLLPPPLLDGAFQGLFPVVDTGYLPVLIRSLRYHRRPASHSYCHVEITFRSPSSLKGNLTLFDADGSVSVEIEGMELRSTKTQEETANAAASDMYEFNWEPQPHPDFADASAANEGDWLIFVDAKGVGKQLAAELECHGQSCVLIEPGTLPLVRTEAGFKIRADSSEDMLPLLQRFAERCRGIVYLWGMDSMPCQGFTASAVLENCHTTTIVPLFLVQALEQVEWRRTPSVTFVTQAAQWVENADQAPEPSQGALWGFGRVCSSELPSFAFTLLDLAAHVDTTLVSHFAQHLLHGSHEQEIALRPIARYVNRLRALTPALLKAQAEQPTPGPAGRLFRLHASTAVEGASVFKEVVHTPAPLAADEVALSHLSFGLTREDLTTRLDPAHLGSAPGQQTLFACAGTVSQVGGQVQPLQPGDIVIGFTGPALSSLAHASTQRVTRAPAHLSPQESALLPAAFLPAYYALDYLAQLEEGEGVLIHDAVDSLGLAAIQLAVLKGARVFATARTAEQRDQLCALGRIQVYDPSSYTFADRLRADTGGRGVEVILNVADGALLAKSLGLLRPLGRFVDVGHARISGNPRLSALLAGKNISYHVFDVASFAAERPAVCTQLLKELVDLFEARLLTPLSPQPYSSSDAARAGSHLETCGDGDCVVLDFSGERPLLAPGLKADVVHGRGTYLVSGGLGGLGLELLDWLVHQGARSVVLIGRSAPSPEANLRLEAARAQGATVTALRADVANADDVARVLDVIHTSLPPLAGIVHAAGVLDDGILTQQTAARFQRVLAPKVKGAWNLHRLTEHLTLDFFVCFSSVASVVGWAGQGNYAAANAFMDTLALHRRSLGKPALSINWGPWSAVGMAANLDERDLQRMKSAGMSPLPAANGLEAMRQLLVHRTSQAGVFEIDWGRLAQAQSGAAPKALFQHLISRAEATVEASFTDRLAQAAPAERGSLLAEQISALLASVIGIDSASGIDRDKSVVDYGVNSLMAMDVRNRLQTVLKVKLPPTLVLKYPTVNAMVKCILEQVLTESDARGENLYWDPQSPEVVHAHEINGPMATLTPSVLNWIHEGHTTHFNVGMLLELSTDTFDLPALKTALRISLGQHDGCRVQLHHEGSELKAEIVPLGDQLPLEEHDFRGLGYEAGAARMIERNEALHRSFTFERGNPLYRAAYYQLDDANPHRFFLIFHHYISDAMSQRIFGLSLISTYLKVLKREPVRFPAKTYSLIDWAARLHRFAYGEAAEQLPYWMQKIEKSRASYIPDEFTANRPRRLDDHAVYIAEWAPAQFERLTEYCRLNNHEVSDAGTYAVLKAFSRLNRADSLWVDLITHARSGIFDDVAMPDHFGQISESASILFELVPDGTHADQIAAMREQRLSVPNGGIGLRALRFINRDPKVREHLAVDESPQVGLNFDLIDYAVEAKQSWFRFAKEGLGTVQTEHLRKTADQLRLAFFISLRARQGGLRIEIGYFKDRFHEHTMARLAQDVFALLAEIAGDREPRASALPHRAPGAATMDAREDVDRHEREAVSASPRLSEVPQGA